VAELDDDDVVGLHGVDDFVEAAFTRIGARAAPANGFVDDVEGEGVGEVDAPACGRVLDVDVGVGRLEG
jgi:hypothetical protein